VSNCLKTVNNTNPITIQTATFEKELFKADLQLVILTRHAPLA
jgi:hypothetical protein